ncbi:DNA replication/repair protein RecF [Altererythrobacter sp. MF3-039]|uniref:DNA replication/repair protein RecF n=1 Tax=Altererythrobacter sp. MF3-039 TaxID=3252901 RepID=UPI00390C8CE7
MTLDRITLSSFRNHQETRLDGTGKFNLLLGENGAGKTNILEALSLLAPGRGLRRSKVSEMASESGNGGFAVAASLGAAGDDVRLATHVEPDFPNRRLVQINGAPAAATRLGEWLAISWLTPAMDGLFADSAGARRRYMDRLAVALDPLHARHATRYEAALRERNRLLSDDVEPDPSWLEGVEAQMAEHGASLTQGRRMLVEQVGAALAEVPEEPFARPALSHVTTEASSPQDLQTLWRSSRRGDRSARRTLAGPHRDELEVTMSRSGMPAAQCSTGEQKAMLIAITLAHSDLAARDRPSVLLLDEVAAHIDPVRRKALFERLAPGAAQVWMTGTEAAPFEAILSSSAGWRVSNGSVETLG